MHEMAFCDQLIRVRYARPDCGSDVGVNRVNHINRVNRRELMFRLSGG